MFVSSYSTYISTNSSNKSTKDKVQTAQNSSTYTSKPEETPKTTLASSAIQIDYISKSKTFHNKLEAQLQQRQLQNPNDKEIAETKNRVTEFSTHKSLQSAKQAYSENSKIFSLFKIPQPTLDQTPKTDKRTSLEIQEIQEQNLRHVMVNTYIQNDKYYQITA